VHRSRRPVGKLSVIKKRFERTVFLLTEEVISIHSTVVQWVFLLHHVRGAVSSGLISSAFLRRSGANLRETCGDGATARHCAAIRPTTYWSASPNEVASMVSVDPGAASIFGVIGTAVSLLAAIPYALAIYRRTVRPHLFTWLVWSVVTAIAAAGQFVAGAGPSAWCTAAIAVTCFLTLVASIFRGERGWTGLDWVFLGAALSAIPLWMLTDDPTISICVVTLIELAGLGPTVRKTIRDPWSESLAYFALCVFKYALALLALSTWSVAVAFYPVVNVIASIGICVVMLVRRQALSNAR
jgi:hypothetical protein